LIRGLDAISVRDWGVNWELASQDCVLHTHEKNFTSNSRFTVEKARKDLSRAHLPGSEKKKREGSCRRLEVLPPQAAGSLWNFKPTGGTRNMDLLVPVAFFEVRARGCCDG
jgi:hypothetical protein